MKLFSITSLTLLALVAASPPNGGKKNRCNARRYDDLVGTIFNPDNNTFRSRDKTTHRDLARDQPYYWIEGCFQSEADLPPKRRGTLYMGLRRGKKVLRFTCDGYNSRDYLCKGRTDDKGEFSLVESLDVSEADEDSED